jgi:hypothetical protein
MSLAGTRYVIPVDVVPMFYSAVGGGWWQARFVFLKPLLFIVTYSGVGVRIFGDDDDVPHLSDAFL